MAYGFEVYRADGSLMFDLNNRITRLHTTISYSITTGTTQNFYIPGISTDGTWAVIPISASSPGVFAEVNISIFADTLQIHCPGYCASHSSTILVFRI